MSKTKIHRRTFLRSAAMSGIALALPPLEAMMGKNGQFHGVARAQSAARRLVIFQFPHGVFLPDWLPTQTGTGWQPSLIMQRQAGDPNIDNAPIPDIASIRADINILTGLSTSRLAGDAHEGPNAAFLTGTVDRNTLLATGPSIETVAGSAIGASTHFPALRIALNETNDSGLHNPLSYSESLQRIAPMASPSALYASLIGYIQPASGSPAGANFPRDLRMSVLDHVRGDINRVTAQCGVGDRRVLSEHFESIREIERRMSSLEPVVCDRPDLSAELAVLPDRSARYNGNWPSTPASVNLPLRADVLMRLGVLALRCDLTRVMFFSMGHSNSRQTLPFLGLGNTDDHLYSHLQMEPTNRQMQLEWNIVSRWKLGQFVRLIERLKQLDGTGGSLLNETMVIASSELANGAGHTNDLIPTVVAGNLGPMAQASGRGQHITLPCAPSAPVFQIPGGGPGGVQTVGQTHPGLCNVNGAYTPLSNLWLTVLHALGVQRSSFGDSTGTLSGLWL